MKPYFVKTPGLIPVLFKDQIWSFSTANKEIYLTFDDGPTPDITDWVLEELAEYSAKATFFCIGKNIQKHPEIYSRILENEHAVGNHTFDHLNGWKTASDAYLENILKAEKLMPEVRLFRPPYGRIRKVQARQLIEKDYNIIMWSVLSADFDSSITSETCYHNVIDNASSGSIIVFHDSIKAAKHLQDVLPRVLDHYSGKGYSFKKIEATDIAAPN